VTSTESNDLERHSMHDIRLKALADMRCVSALENQELYFFADAGLDGFCQNRMDTKLKRTVLFSG